MKEIKHGETKIKEDNSRVLIITYNDGTTEERKLATHGTHKLKHKDMV